MPEKPEGKSFGLGSFMRRNRKKTAAPVQLPSSASAASECEHENAKAPRATGQRFVPRHAERDMILSMPVKRRPDPVAKANEARLQNVCSEIGFSTTQHPKSAPLHPKLHLSRQYEVQAPGSVVASSRYRDLQALSGPSRSISTPPPSRAESQSSLGIEDPCSKASVVVDVQKPPMPSFYAVSKSLSFHVDDADPGAAMTNGSGGVVSSVLAPVGGVGPAATGLIDRPATTPRGRPYFSHSNTTPNLRLSHGKGKQKASESNIYQDMSTGPLQREISPEMREAYIIDTKSVQPGKSHILSATTPSSKCSFTESIKSTPSQSVADAWSSSPTARQGSTSTFQTEQTEYTDHRKSDLKRQEEPGLEKDISNPERSKDLT